MLLQEIKAAKMVESRMADNWGILGSFLCIEEKEEGVSWKLSMFAFRKLSVLSRKGEGITISVENFISQNRKTTNEEIFRALQNLCHRENRERKENLS